MPICDAITAVWQESEGTPNQFVWTADCAAARDRLEAMQAAPLATLTQHGRLHDPGHY